MDPQAPDLAAVDAALAAKQERDRAYSIVRGERQRILQKQSPSAERERVLRLLDKLARRIQGR